MSESSQFGNGEAEAVFVSLAEDVKTVLVQIMNQTELSAEDPAAGLAEVRGSAARTIEQIDAYAFSRRQTRLDLEAVPVSAVLYDAAEELRPLARRYQADINIDVAGRYGPVMAHRQGLQRAMVALGTIILQQDTARRPEIVLSVYRSRRGLAAGVFGGPLAVDRQLYSRALRQPRFSTAQPNFSSLQTAHDIMRRMSAELRVAQRRQLVGLAANFPLSQQLQLV